MANRIIVSKDTNTVTVSARGPQGIPGPPGGASAWGGITGTLADQTDLQAALDGKATSAQGALADSALQNGDNVSLLANDAEYITDGVLVRRIFTKSDLPAPVAGVITLPDTDVRYSIFATIDLAGDRLVFQGASVQVYGASPNVGFISTTTENLITVEKTIDFRNLNLIGFSASSLLSAVNAATHALTMDSVGLVGGPNTDLLCVDNYENLVVNLVGFTSGKRGICLANIITHVSINLCQFEVDVVGINIDLNGCLSEAISIHNCVSVLSATSTFLSASPDNGNITASGGGTITENKIDNTTAGSVISTGLSPLDLRWLAIGNNNINGSDRINPSGWAFYVDGDTVVQNAGTTPVKFSVDGVGSNSNSDFAPRVIRGISELWDVSTNEMVPITLGDSFNLRLAFTVRSKSGNPNILTIVFDIGGAAGITIPVFTSSVATPNAFPRAVAVSIPLFALNAFLANNGRIFVFTDAGSLNLDARSIMIQRISSGAS